MLLRVTIGQDFLNIQKASNIVMKICIHGEFLENIKQNRRQCQGFMR